MMSSWRLKLDRAEKHLRELDQAAEAYAISRPFSIERTLPQGTSGDRWRYRLRMLQPDPRLAIIVGDAVHNMRSALDHLAVALAPAKRRRSASYPIEMHNIWAADSSGQLRPHYADQRDAYNSKVKGMKQGAIDAIEELQPYHAKVVRAHALAVLSILDNADKHRELVTLAAGLDNATTTVTVRGVILEQEASGFRSDGDDICHFGSPDADLTERDIDVAVSGSARLVLDVGIPAGVTPIAGLWDILNWLRDHLVPELEPFVLSA